MEKLILKNFLSPGDVVMLTAALRDLHRAHPGRFLTDVQTSCPQLWENNPYLTPLEEHEPEVRSLICHYPLIHRSNQAPFHFIHGFCQYLNEKLAVNIQPTVFRGDIHLSAEERSAPLQLGKFRADQAEPYWIVSAGGKQDFTIKWWDDRRYQEVVDHFRGRIRFVQVGAKGHYHPRLKGAIDLRGKTDLRQLIRLLFDAQGVITPVSLLMHLAAAVPTRRELDHAGKNGSKPVVSSRACVVIAGGREPSHWEAYPTHQFLHTIGMLPCCRTGGCWRSRTVPLEDGSEKDQPEHLCVDVVGRLPRCMDMITSADVIRRIEMYLDAGAVQQPELQGPPPDAFSRPTERLEIKRPGYLTNENARSKAEEFIATIPPFPESHVGRGIVICGGGIKYFTCAWVTIKMLRRLGCSLPIQLWYLGRKEVDERMEALLEPLQVTCVDALEIKKNRPVRILNGWELKPYSILNSPFREVIFLDADSMPLVNPESLFETSEYQQSGSIFWPDLGRLKRSRAIWRLCGVEYRDEPEFESGQIVVDKQRCWKALSLAMWFNEHSDFFYRHIHGDKDTFHFAFRKLGQSYAMPNTPVQVLGGVFCQHDFQGQRVFQHYTRNKWSLFSDRSTIPGLFYEYECRDFLRELRELWPEAGRHLRRFRTGDKNPRELDAAQVLLNEIHEYHRLGWESRAMQFLQDGTIGTGAAALEQFWDVQEQKGAMTLLISSEKASTCRLKRIAPGRWKGRWLVHQKMPVELSILEEANASWQPVNKQPQNNGQTSQVNGAVHSSRHVVFRADINSYTGYGLHACQIVSDLETFGYEVDVHPFAIDEKFSHIPEHIKKNMVPEEPHSEWELLLHPPNLIPDRAKRTLYFTMWESSRLPAGLCGSLNRSESVIVPCQWNREAFRASGVKVPIHVVPLGINTSAFKYSPMKLDGACVFGTAGRMAHGGMRKGINEVITAFQKAFPTQSDVQLWVKGFPDCAIHPVKDSRIVILQKFLSEGQLAEWLSGLTCFVSASRGEGWGLLQHQALAIGRPVISVQYGGVAEFFNSSMGYPVAFTEVPAEGEYARCGVWARLNEDDLVEQFRRVYRDREEAKRLGQTGAEAMGRFTWRNSSERLLVVMKEVGMVE